MAAQGTKPERVRQKDRGAQNNTAKKAKPDGEASSSRSSSSSSSDEEEEDIFSRTSLDLSKNPMPDVQGLTKTLSQFKQLQKLDISGMATSQTNQRGLSSLEWLGEAVLKSKKADGGISFGERLTWLKMTDNPTLGNEAGAKAWSGIERLVKLTVLNASSCALTIAPPASALLQMPTLGALILAHNNISSLKHIPFLPKLNTLVLSDNKISKLPKELPANVPSLKKLSITHNDLRWIYDDDESPLPDFSLCSHLREVRLSANGKLKRLPSHMSTWGRGEGASKLGTGLDTLDISDCGLKNWEDIQAILEMGGSNDTHYKRRRGLGNLTCKGNALAKLPGYREKLLEAHPSLRTIDGERVMIRAKTDEEEANEIVETTPASKKPPEKKIIKRREKDDKAAKPAPKATTNEKKQAELRGAKMEPKHQLSRDEKVKLRKRGKRGSSGVKEKEIEKESAKLQPAPNMKEGKQPQAKGKEKPSVESSPSKKVDRAVTRAGPPPPPRPTSSKGAERKGKAKAIAENKKSTKRKAWDTEGDVEPPKKTQRSQPPPSQEKKQGKEPSSVAAIVQLKKEPISKKGVAKPVIWGALGAVQDGLGEGSGWS